MRWVRIAARIVAALAGAVAGFYAGGNAGCAVFEATTPPPVQCGYEWQGFGHVVFGMIGGALLAGFLAQWLVALALRRRDR